jgi:hypothetical protein
MSIVTASLGASVARVILPDLFVKLREYRPNITVTIDCKKLLAQSGQPLARADDQSGRATPPLMQHVYPIAMRSRDRHGPGKALGLEAQ